MIKVAGAIFIGSLAAAAVAQASPGGSELQKMPDQQSTVQDEGLNRQILQTLKDIRDSQLSVLQAQVEILSILRSSARPPAAAHGHGAEASPGHRSGGAPVAANAATPVARASTSAAR